MNASTQAPAQAAPATRLRLTRRGRIVFTAMAALPLAAGALALAVNGGVAAAGERGPGQSFEYLTIAAGQSLWQVAEDVAPTDDPRDVIAAIVDLNRLTSEAVQPGQRIALPAGLEQHAGTIDG
ncbi:hypothetical protein [Cryobacterium tepidiphilum]|jgi:hypothetical protein|uniref:LysM peptidoglycan-binding domain-containing protein n=1 Tax=Cryobacterium tepidiphilum TaxID=2486026 RepID=A0A3M8LAI7_9MICO|nr:hypothetical protein [Cryobacterium tepidiphilum]RNE62511.1 hypothetical protein EEJ31_07785 [Cryobacterium tepidiphilum]